MPETTLLLEMGALLLVIGAFAGVLAGLLGVGGGIVLVPAFFYAFTTLGYDSPFLMQICLATSLATIIVTSVRSVLSHNRKGAVDWDILKGWALGIMIGAIAGRSVVSALRSTELQIIFGAIASLIGLYLIAGKASWRLGDRLPMGWRGFLMSPVLGAVSVMLGIGGGSLGVPTMTLFGTPIHRAVATAAGFGVVIAVPSVIGFLLVDLPEGVAPWGTIGAVNVPAFLLVIAMTLITTPYGATLAHRTDAKRLKRIFGGFLILVALNMLRKALV